MNKEGQVIHSMPFLLINPSAAWKSVWNGIILMLILFLAIVVPYRISFEDNPSEEWILADNCTDFLFIIDLIFNFFTCFEDENGVLGKLTCIVIYIYL